MLAFVPGALMLYVLGWLAQAMAGYVGAAGWGLEYVIFALAIGLVINHTVGVPAWLREGVRTEYYIKTGLVVLGATILFDEIVGAGMLGILQALIVVLSVWAFAFWLCQAPEAWTTNWRRCWRARCRSAASRRPSPRAARFRATGRSCPT